MTAYLVKASGCDDSTRVVVDLDPEQAAAVATVAAAVTAASEFDCQPRLAITPLAEVDEDEMDLIGMRGAL